MKKLVVIPAYNEQETIISTIEDLRKHAPDFEYVVINDCSGDQTRELCVKNDVHVLNLPVNLGIGGAVQTGYLYAYSHDYDVAVQFDGDGQHDARYLKDMEKAMEEKHADLVIGSRFIEKKGFQSSKMRRFGIAFFSFWLKALFGKKVTDPTSGMRMCNRTAMKLFIRDYPGDYPEPETLARLMRHRLKVVEVPVRMRERSGGVSSISSGKSVYYMLKVSMAILIERFR